MCTYTLYTYMDPCTYDIHQHIQKQDKTQSTHTHTQMVQRYHISLAPGKEDVGMATGATIHTENGLWVNLNRRNWGGHEDDVTWPWLWLWLWLWPCLWLWPWLWPWLSQCDCDRDRKSLCFGGKTWVIFKDIRYLTCHGHVSRRRHAPYLWRY
jgi:hypothetical protein